MELSKLQIDWQINIIAHLKFNFYFLVGLKCACHKNATVVGAVTMMECLWAAVATFHYMIIISHQSLSRNTGKHS